MMQVILKSQPTLNPIELCGMKVSPNLRASQASTELSQWDAFEFSDKLETAPGCAQADELVR